MRSRVCGPPHNNRAFMNAGGRADASNNCLRRRNSPWFWWALATVANKPDTDDTVVGGVFLNGDEDPRIQRSGAIWTIWLVTQRQDPAGLRPQCRNVSRRDGTEFEARV